MKNVFALLLGENAEFGQYTFEITLDKNRKRTRFCMGEDALFELTRLTFGWDGEYWDRMLDGEMTAVQASQFLSSCNFVYFQFDASWKREMFSTLFQRAKDKQKEKKEGGEPAPSPATKEDGGH